MPFTNAIKSEIHDEYKLLSLCLLLTIFGGTSYNAFYVLVCQQQTLCVSR